MSDPDYALHCALSDWTERRFSDVESPLAAQAEAMVRVKRSKSRRHVRGASSWTLEDEALFRSRLGDLYEARARLVRGGAA